MYSIIIAYYIHVCMPVATMSCSYTAPATGHTVGSSAQPVSARLMDKYQLSTTAQASEPKKEDPLSSLPPPGVVNQHGCIKLFCLTF